MIFSPLLPIGLTDDPDSSTSLYPTSDRHMNPREISGLAKNSSFAFGVR
jgi:hypothetical protein